MLSALLRLALNEMVGPNISVPDRVAGAALGALRIALLAIMLVVVFDRTIPPGQESSAAQRGLRVLPPEIEAYIDRLKRYPPIAPIRVCAPGIRGRSWSGSRSRSRCSGMVGWNSLSVCVRRGPVHRADRQHAITFVGLKKGDTIAFGKRDIVDWIYMDAGVMKGNYSACAVLKAALPRDRAAFKRRFGLEFDF